MLIRCSDNCKFQEDGFCGLKNIYSATITGSTSEINNSGCIYYKPKNQKNQTPAKSIESERERRKYF